MREIITSQDKPGRFLVGIFTVLFMLVVWPYAMPLFWAVVLSILLQPVWKALDRSFKGKTALKGLLMVLLIIVVLILPFVLVLLALPSQINTLMQVIPEYRTTFTNMINDALGHLPSNISLQLQSAVSSISQDNMGSATKALVNLISKAASSALNFFAEVTLMMFMLYYFFTDGANIYARAVSYLPFTDTLVARLTDRFVAITKATIGGVFAIAIAQGAVAALCYWALGVQAPIALGLATMVASLIPAVGSGLVWVPVAIVLAVNGEVGAGLIMLALGFGVISMVDNLLRPRLVGSKAQIPDFVILLTTLGGLAVFGVSGIVLGPMIAGMSIALWKMTKPDSTDATAADSGTAKSTKAKAG